MLQRSIVHSALVMIALSAWGQARNMHGVLQGTSTGDPGTLLHFSGAIPQQSVFPSLALGECSAVISDTSGVLQFFCISGYFYDTTGTTFFQDLNAPGCNDATQGSLILPRPGASSIYDVVLLQTTAYLSSYPRASIVTVDMALNGGLGGSTGSTTFGGPFTEKLTGCPHGNGEDYWVVTHAWQSDAFFAYRETMAGLDTNAVVSHAGAIHSAAYGGCDSDMNYQGEMKFSYLGDRLALGNQNVQCQPDIEQLQPAIVQLFHFDDLTADVSYWMNLPGHHLTYGLDFSHDGSKLYVAGTDSLVHYVDQYDLSAGDTVAIQQSRYRVYDTTYAFVNGRRPNAMAFAPDGRLYVSHTGSSLDAILHPDLPGAACGYVHDYAQLDQQEYFGAHWNQLKRYNDSEFKQGHTGVLESPAASEFAIWPNPTNSTCWLRLPRDVDHCDLQLIDATGRSVKTWSGLMPGIRSLDLDGLGSGAYVIVLRQGNTIANHARLVIE